jgi:CheY-like chemotaxis protein
MIPPGNILVVDDDPAFSEMYRDLLTAEGYQVDLAADRESALAKLSSSRWDVVVLDQRLRGAEGGDTGIDLIAEIIPTGAKVIVATGYADPKMIERAFRDGAYDYLEKLPTLPMLLRIKVRNALETVRERRLAALDKPGKEKAIRELWASACSEANSQRKGALLEELLVLLFKSVDGFKHAETRRSSPDEEIDVFIRNESTDPFWSAERSPYIIVECKNWSAPIGPDQLVVFRNKIENRGGRCRLGFFVATGGFTKGFHTQSATFRKGDILIVPLGPQDIEELVNSTDRNEALKKVHARTVMAGNGH